MEAWFLSLRHSLLAKETDTRTTAYVEERMNTGLYVDPGQVSLEQLRGSNNSVENILFKFIAIGYPLV